jgi:hypothetical protein
MAGEKKGKTSKSSKTSESTKSTKSTTKTAKSPKASKAKGTSTIMTKLKEYTRDITQHEKALVKLRKSREKAVIKELSKVRCAMCSGRIKEYNEKKLDPDMSVCAMYLYTKDQEHAAEDSAFIKHGTLMVSNPGRLYQVGIVRATVSMVHKHFNILSKDQGTYLQYVNNNDYDDYEKAIPAHESCLSSFTKWMGTNKSVNRKSKSLFAKMYKNYQKNNCCTTKRSRRKTLSEFLDSLL